MKTNLTPLHQLLIRAFSFITICMLGACIQEEAIEQQQQLTPDFVDETLLKTDEDRANAELILTVTRVLRTIYKDRMVIEEVNAAIASGYYQDETVLLKDLLNPQSSPIYQLPQFKERLIKRGFKVGLFKASFEKELGIESSDNLKSNDLDFEDNGVSIYFPYHEDTQYLHYLYSVAPATVEANQQLIPMPYGPDPDIVNPPGHVIMIDDNYAAAYPTHIVGMDAEMHSTSDTESCDGALWVRIGYIRVTYLDYDPLFGFKKLNSGGADMRFIMAQATQPYSPVTTYQVRHRQEIGRREARYGYWVPIWGTYEPFWTEGEYSKTKLFGIYEEDDTDWRRSFSGNIQYTSNGFTTYPSYYFEVATKNDVVSDRTFARTYLLASAAANGHTSSYQTGYGPQYDCTDNNCKFSIPLECY